MVVMIVIVVVVMMVVVELNGYLKCSSFKLYARLFVKIQKTRRKNNYFVTNTFTRDIHTHIFQNHLPEFFPNKTRKEKYGVKKNETEKKRTYIHTTKQKKIQNVRRVKQRLKQS